MKIETLQQPEAATGNKLAALGKVEFGQQFGVSKRTVDGWLACGCPHLKLSSRMVRLPVVEASAWVKEKFLTKRRAVAEWIFKQATTQNYMHKNTKLDELHFNEVEKITQAMDLTKSDQRRAAFELEKKFAEKHLPSLKFFMNSKIAEVTL
jgi:hypothetical protein